MVGAASVACVVVEPIAGEGGFVVPEPGWLAGLAQWCRANGVVFVADEIQSGFGRTGAWFACEHEGVVPDIVTTAKSLGGGLPIAGGDGTGRPHGRGAPRGPRGHLRRQPAGVRGGAGRHRHHGERRACSSGPAASAR